ncbi:recombination regulator RecX [Bacillus sp. T3]|uniref:recombination regulator RecX n=1 Tax=Bacillus sp. T3 TaxID=467262 RepID=UPI00298132DD|nr:recombination regulator RecX [Bacillus sp. T3]
MEEVIYVPTIITKITVQQKQKDRYNIFVDNGDGEKYGFSVDEDVLIKYQLKKGQNLDDFAVSEIFYQDDIRKAYSQAVQYLAARMRSELEVRQHLQKKELDENIINEVIHKLYQYQFLNDHEFAVAFVRTQMNTTDKGTIVIGQELKEKGIKDEILETSLLEYPYERQFEQCFNLSKKFVEKNKKESAKFLKQKLEQMLIRKGYPFDIIQETIRDIDFDKGEDMEMEALRKQGDKLLGKYSRYSGYEFTQKMKQALYRKGFPMDLIDQYLAENQGNDES